MKLGRVYNSGISRITYLFDISYTFTAPPPSPAPHEGHRRLTVLLPTFSIYLIRRSNHPFLEDLTADTLSHKTHCESGCHPC